MDNVKNQAQMNEAFERLFCGQGKDGDGFLLTGEKTFPVPNKAMPIKEAEAVIRKFFSL